MKAPAGWEVIDAMVHCKPSQPGRGLHEPKVSPDEIVARAMACSPSVLTRVPQRLAAVGYSPMERREF
jgi:hypothetical protein